MNMMSMEDEVLYDVKYIDELNAYRVTSPDVKGLCVIEPTVRLALSKAKSLANVIQTYRIEGSDENQ